MRLVTFEAGQGSRPGVGLDESTILDLDAALAGAPAAGQAPFGSLHALIGRGPAALEAIERLLARLTPYADAPLSGRHVLVTSGPTHEPIDPVRYIANRSSGKQGHAIARAAASGSRAVSHVDSSSACGAPLNGEIGTPEIPFIIRHWSRTGRSDAIAGGGDSW